MIASVGPGFGSGLSVAVNPGCADVLTSASMIPLYTTGPIPKNYFDMQAWSVWFIWSIWWVWFNQTIETDQTDRTDQRDQTDQTNQMNKVDWRTFSAAG